MKLQDIKKSYDVVISLGSSCLPTYQIKRCNLRSFSGPLDWVLSPSTPDISRLLKNRLNGLMEPGNMNLVQGPYWNLLNDESEGQGAQTYQVKDTNYNITSVHDFPVMSSQPWDITYPDYKKKLNMRISRFLQKITASNSILFIRTEANYDETVELQSALSQLTNKQFNLLIVNLVVGSKQVLEKDWGLPRVCSVDCPHRNDLWHGEDSAWDYILDGIKIN
ncbi:papain-like cysteine peptidase [Priestia megaterium]|uniref:papain-like cysteine peptidase n=1 Tax=Priestia megaterium TaxID=1404 RepID=UPI0021D6856F|nr:papain-like cysteine peptidase [Priestia megaterium]MCU7741460.1 papain-like cysteine peptidase [Priestia megaterium]